MTQTTAARPPIRSRLRDALRHPLRLAAMATGVAALVAGCKTAPPPAPVPASGAAPGQSAANTPREYRRDAASHLYRLNSERIYPGRLPPLLYAVGTLEVDLDNRGNVLATRWMRAPSHAPEVVAEIERTVRRASPFPVPARLGRVTYTDTWLWDRSGRFQLDTLTEGQD